MSGPLEGIKVIDLSMGGVGPLAGVMLGELGADVIKVEPPQCDWIRTFISSKNGLNPTFIACNLTKRAIVLDLKKEPDREIALKLAARSDVFIENFRPGVMEKLGLGYEAIAEVNPRIIYCSASGYGRVGPYSRKGCVDHLAQAFSGFWSLNGEPGSRGEMLRNVVHIDFSTSTFICQAILVALFVRERAGIGQRIDTSMLSTAIGLQVSRAAEYFATGQNPQPMGTASPNIVPSQAFKTKDDIHINVSVTTEKQWLNLTKTLDRDDLASDPRFQTNPERVKHRNELIPLLEEVFLTKGASEWLTLLEAEGIPCGPYLNPGQLLSHPQTLENEVVIEVAQPAWDKVRVAGLPWRFSRTPAAITRPAPLIGQHQEEVLQEVR